MLLKLLATKHTHQIVYNYIFRVYIKVFFCLFTFIQLHIDEMTIKKK